MGETSANLPRPDVNSVTGYPGDHGFNWIIPTNFLNPCRPNVYAYAIDIEDSSQSTLLNNSTTGDSYSLMPYLQISIDNFPESLPIVIGISSQYATALSTLTWNGIQFINTKDHGRLVQSDVVLADEYNPSDETYNYGAECYNPTEAGSHYDDTNFGGACSSSSIISISTPASDQLQSNCNMAFYCAPYSSSPDCSSAVNTTVLSGTYITKTVTIGLSSSDFYDYTNVANYQNIIVERLDFRILSTETHLAVACFEPVAAYFNGGSGYFTNMGYYNFRYSGQK